MNKHPLQIGRPRKYETPEDLLKAANAYFVFVHENPLQEQKLITVAQGGDAGSKVEDHALKKSRVMSIGGFCVHAAMSHETFAQYRERPDFIEVTRAIVETIENYQLEGASSGFFNPNIIAQKLGLNKQEIKNDQSIIVKTANGEKLNDLINIGD